MREIIFSCPICLRNHLSGHDESFSLLTLVQREISCEDWQEEISLMSSANNYEYLLITTGT